MSEPIGWSEGEGDLGEEVDIAERAADAIVSPASMPLMAAVAAAWSIAFAVCFNAGGIIESLCRRDVVVRVRVGIVEDPLRRKGRRGRVVSGRNIFFFLGGGYFRSVSSLTRFFFVSKELPSFLFHDKLKASGGRGLFIYISPNANTLKFYPYTGPEPCWGSGYTIVTSNLSGLIYTLGNVSGDRTAIPNQLWNWGGGLHSSRYLVSKLGDQERAG